MPSNSRVLGNVPKTVSKNKAYGVDKSPGPYVATVKNNVDPTRSCRLQVFIPDFGGSETEESNWVTVGYASPFMGMSRFPRVREEKSQENIYEKVNHSYGMWMSPPDVGNFVLVTFIAGDTNKGYWFACVAPELTQYATPGGAGSMFDTRKTTVDPGLIAQLPTPPYPVTEFNDVNKGLFPKWNDFLEIPKPIHEAQALRLLREGLEDDKIRGVITSSGQRESPSRVFGISTPGPQTPGPDHDLAAAIGDMPDPMGVKGPQYRLGGHTFVMDDGDDKGKNRIVRLRTSSGHQIMLNDTHGFIYVANAEGTAWFEMTKDGKFYFYGKDSISFRTEKDFNVHADKDINMYAGAAMNKYAVSDMVQETAGLMSLRAEGELNMFGSMVGLKSSSKLAIQSDTFTSLKVGTDLAIQTGGKITLKAATTIGTQSGTDTTMLSGATLVMSSAGNLSLKTGAALATQSGGNTTHLAGGQILETASQIHMNGPGAPAAPAAPASIDAKAFKKPAPIDRAFHYDPKPIEKYPKWKPMEIPFVSSCPIVPTHEPYNFPDKSPARPDCCNGVGGTVEETHVKPHAQPPKGGESLTNAGPIPRLTDVTLP